MDRYRTYVRAAFMVVALFLVTACTQAPPVKSTNVPTSSGVGQQAEVPPLANLPESAPKASDKSACPSPEVTVSEGWVRLPDDKLRDGDSLVLVNPTYKVALVGRFFSERTLPAVAIAEVTASYIENGFDVDSPFLSEDGTWSSVAMRREGKEIVLGMKMLECGENHAMYLSAHGSTDSAKALASAMETVLSSLSVPSK